MGRTGVQAGGGAAPSHEVEPLSLPFPAWSLLRSELPHSPLLYVSGVEWAGLKQTNCIRTVLDRCLEPTWHRFQEQILSTCSYKHKCFPKTFVRSLVWKLTYKLSMGRTGVQAGGGAAPSHEVEPLSLPPSAGSWTQPPIGSLSSDRKLTVSKNR